MHRLPSLPLAVLCAQKPKVLLAHGRRVCGNRRLLERRLEKALQAARLLWGSALLPAVFRRFCRALQAGLKQNRRQSMAGTFGALPEQGLEHCTAATEPGHFSAPRHCAKATRMFFCYASRWSVLCELAQLPFSCRGGFCVIFSSLLYYAPACPHKSAKKVCPPRPLHFPSKNGGACPGVKAGDHDAGGLADGSLYLRRSFRIIRRVFTFLCYYCDTGEPFGEKFWKHGADIL